MTRDAFKHGPHEVHTNKLKNGLFHHVVGYGNNESHFLSTSPDHNHDDSYLARLDGDKDYEHGLKIDMSGVKPEHKGKGYGKTLYLSALAHHGKLASDSKLTRRSNAVWEFIPKVTQGMAQVNLANFVRLSEDENHPDYHTFHTAKADKDQLQSLLFDKSFKKNESNDLNKVYIMDDLVSDSIGLGSIHPFTPNDKHLSTNKLKNGLFHHIISHAKNPGYIHHVLSNSPDHLDHKSYLSHLSGIKVSNNEDSPLQIGMAKVKSEHKGKGYGKTLYLSALAHHGELESDQNLTSRSHKVWESLGKLGQGHVNVDLSNTTQDGFSDDTLSTHKATANKDSLSKILFDK
jgi:predicted GNAT family acetyltransferase